MRKYRFLALLTALLLLFSACSAADGTYVYAEGGHTHIYGAWYDVTPVTCLAAGEHICYCKICGVSALETVPVAEEIAARAHAFDDTVVPPTESVGGYTRRVCRLCGYVVERADEIPAIYSLFLPEADLAPVEGVVAQLAFGTGKTADMHRNPVLAAANVQTQVNAVPALYLATALVSAEAVAAGELSWSDSVTVTAALLAGRDPGRYREGMEVSIASLVKACLTAESDVAVAALAARLCASDALFAERLNARMAALGVRKTVFSATAGDVGTTTLFDSAVLLWRVLKDPALAAEMDLGFAYAGKQCAAFFEAESFRLSAVFYGGEYYIAAFAGENLPVTAETEIYGSI